MFRQCFHVGACYLLMLSVFRLKRTNSGAFIDGDSSSLAGDDLKRGGVRATAGPRLGWNGHTTESPNLNKTLKELVVQLFASCLSFTV